MINFCETSVSFSRTKLYCREEKNQHNLHLHSELGQTFLSSVFVHTNDWETSQYSCILRIYSLKMFQRTNQVSNVVVARPSHVISVDGRAA